MTAASLELPLAGSADRASHAVRMLQVFSVALMVFPGDYVVRTIGGDGYAAALVSYLMFLAWVAGTILGHHNPLGYRYPVRIVLAWMWIAGLISYVLMDRAFMTGTQLAAADRWLMQLAGISGIILVTAEGLHSLEDIRRVLRVLTWGGAFCGLVALLQFKARINLTDYYLKIPGFSVDASDTGNLGIILRGALNRVPGTATDAIELAVASSMLLALAIYLMMHDTERPLWKRVVPVIMIGLSVAASVSRSGIIGVALAVGLLIVSLPPARRLKGLAAIPVCLGVVFVGAHGMIGTLSNFFAAGNSDPSISHRTNNYPYVWALVQRAPLFGSGGGTYIPDSSVHIFDNQYLTIAVELGVVGVLALIVYLGWPVVVAFAARRHTRNQELRDLCAALAGAELAAMACAATFDGLSFPMFFNLQALVVGLIGAVWRLIHEDKDSVKTL